MRALPARRPRRPADGLDARRHALDWVHGRCPRPRRPAARAVRELLRQVGVLHVDETPVRADGGLAYVHAASTEFLTAMQTGGRTTDDIDAGKILPGYTGTIVRDGYAGYVHLIDAHHAWCGAHLLRDLAAFHRADPQGQLWAAAMADTLTDAHHHAQAARAAGHDSLAPDVLSVIRRRYRGATTAGISGNTARAGPLATLHLRSL